MTQTQEKRWWSIFKYTVTNQRELLSLKMILYAKLIKGHVNLVFVISIFIRFVKNLVVPDYINILKLKNILLYQIDLH